MELGERTETCSGDTDQFPKISLFRLYMHCFLLYHARRRSTIHILKFDPSCTTWRAANNCAFPGHYRVCTANGSRRESKFSEGNLWLELGVRLTLIQMHAASRKRHVALLLVQETMERASTGSRRYLSPTFYRRQLRELTFTGFACDETPLCKVRLILDAMWMSENIL